MVATRAASRLPFFIIYWPAVAATNNRLNCQLPGLRTAVFCRCIVLLPVRHTQPRYHKHSCKHQAWLRSSLVAPSATLMHAPPGELLLLACRRTDLNWRWLGVRYILVEQHLTPLWPGQRSRVLDFPQHGSTQRTATRRARLDTRC